MNQSMVRKWKGNGVDWRTSRVEWELGLDEESEREGELRFNPSISINRRIERIVDDQAEMKVSVSLGTLRLRTRYPFKTRTSSPESPAFCDSYHATVPPSTFSRIEVGP